MNIRVRMVLLAIGLALIVGSLTSARKGMLAMKAEDADLRPRREQKAAEFERSNQKQKRTHIFNSAAVEERESAFIEIAQRLKNESYETLLDELQSLEAERAKVMASIKSQEEELSSLVRAVGMTPDEIEQLFAGVSQASQREEPFFIKLGNWRNSVRVLEAIEIRITIQAEYLNSRFGDFKLEGKWAPEFSQAK